ncbi:MAG: ABC transporter permease [Thermoplasmata archaeon]|jgi:peptide/nickel transport system permease protein|nr:ABC transporter permease [Thermoplasmata archaeon]
MAGMRGYVLRKTVYLVITLFIIISFNFFLFRIMPGDPAKVLVPKTADQELIDEIRAEFYLDRPIHEQYARYVISVFQLDFGISTGVRKFADINDIIGPAVFNTILLVGIGTALAIFLGITIGKFAAWRRGKPADAMSMSFALVFYSMPTFLFALLILMVFAGELRWFPSSQAYGQLPFVDRAPRYDDMAIWEKILSRGYHLVLPIIAFTLEIMAEFAIIMRNSLTDVLTEDYITTARAKGLSNKAILNDHAMRNAMLPVVTVMAISIGWMLGGTIMVEMVFSYEGVGLLTWDAVVYLDYPLLQALFLLMAIAVLFANLIADIIYTYLDPRVKV